MHYSGVQHVLLLYRHPVVQRLAAYRHDGNDTPILVWLTRPFYMERQYEGCLVKA